ncbi:LysR family transcriptional regulator [Rhodobacterales bacterium 52_120_T64]|nr:LysR family transcriptional regulator [Rhodobacterales bacterium 52_120_T64]
MSISKLRWDDLKVFLQVARLNSLSNAGRALKMDPATVGRRVQRLEEDLTARLFTKSPQGYDLTDAGQRLMTHASMMEQSLLAAESEVKGQSNVLSGSVRIGAPDGSANYLLPQVCAEIVDENPGLEVQLVALPRVFNLSKREADMAVTVSLPQAGRLTVQRISDYHLHLAASEEYLKTHPPITKLGDLKDHRMIGYISDLIFDQELDYMGDAGKGLQPDLTSNSFSVQLNWAQRGAGVCIVHDFAIPTFPNLKKILTDQLSLKRSFFLIRHKDDQRVERLNRFAEIFAKKIRLEVQRLEALT